jgi:protein gp37
VSDRTGIEWTDATWNPTRGCSRVSEGCRNCYAERATARFLKVWGTIEGLAKFTPSGPRWSGNVVLHESALDRPLRWRRPRRIFVNSMSDLFHEKLSDEAIDQVFAVMAIAHQHTFQVLTKRPARMLEYTSAPARAETVGIAMAHRMCGIAPPSVPRHLQPPWPLPNVWLGVSVENQATADERIPLLLQTLAAIRFLSCEPLLGSIDLRRYIFCPGVEESESHGRTVHRHNGACCSQPRVDWVIVGGESGPGARPMHPAWARALRDQCSESRAAFFFKQWGEWLPREWGDIVDLPRYDGSSRIGFFQDGLFSQAGSHSDYQNMTRIGKAKAGRLLDGREHSEFPS